MGNNQWCLCNQTQKRNSLFGQSLGKTVMASTPLNDAPKPVGAIGHPPKKETHEFWGKMLPTDLMSPLTCFPLVLRKNWLPQLLKSSSRHPRYTRSKTKSTAAGTVALIKKTLPGLSIARRGVEKVWSRDVAWELQTNTDERCKDCVEGVQEDWMYGGSACRLESPWARFLRAWAPRLSQTVDVITS